MKITIRDLPVAERLSPKFMDALEVFLPKWLDSLLPYYKEAKEQVKERRLALVVSRLFCYKLNQL